MSKKEEPAENVSTTSLILGDCLERLQTVPTDSVDFVFGDLPYSTSAYKSDTPIDLTALWPQLHRIVKPTGVIALTATCPFNATLIASNITNFRYRWVWNKIQGGNFQLAKLQPMNNLEDILIFSEAKAANLAKQQATYYPQMEVRDMPVQSGGVPGKTGLLNSNSMVAQKKMRSHKYPTALLQFAKPHSSKRRHPTEKPVDLLRYLIVTYTQPKDTVLDFCMGSGSTGEACVLLGRNFVGIEKDAAFFEVSHQRLKSLQSHTLMISR